MAKFVCVCGHVIPISGPIPNPDEWQLISDVKFDQFEGLTDADEMYRSATVMYRCPQSDHLWIFWEGFTARPSLYEPQELSPRQAAFWNLSAPDEMAESPKSPDDPVRSEIPKTGL